MPKDPRSRIWKPLDPNQRQIRLFVLAPSQDRNETLRGRLAVVSLLHHQIYDAVSHAWGTAQNSKSLLVDGVRWPITVSLAQCLQEFRHSSRERPFWIDAICVNQFDLNERAQQVKLMQHIFSNAVTVCIWLGVDADSMRQAMNTIRRIGFFNEHHSGAVNNAGELAMLTEFTKPEWWERLWVVQEAALARNALFAATACRVDLVSVRKYYYQFLRLRREKKHYQDLCDDEKIAMTRSGKRLQRLLRAVDLLRDARFQSPPQRAATLVEQLCFKREMRVYDPRDRVYGFLGICTALFGQEFIEADYTASVTTVYTNFAFKMITASRSLIILNQASQFHNSMIDLPSWVPDWTSSYDHSAPLYHRSVVEGDKIMFFNATRGMAAMAPPVLHNSSSSVKLGLKGIVIGVVKKVTSICELEEYADIVSTNAHMLNVLDEWRKSYRQWSQYSGAPGRGRSFDYDQKAFACTVLREPPDSSFGKRNAASLGNSSAGDAVEALSVVMKDLSLNKPVSTSAEFKRLYTSLHGSLFFISSTGFPGLGPPDTQQDDVLAILSGGDVPYVLRRSEDRSRADLYTFVGECYLHGAMNGEMVPREIGSLQSIWLE